jgi:DNA invertase Pin-like site-specific DNA recombinase
MKSMKLIGYIRVSTARQGEGFSLKAQKEAITRYCKTYKHKLIAIEAESKSAIRERPVFDKLFKKLIAPNSNLDGLIVAKLDRLGRSVKDLADIAAELHQHKKQLISVADNIDTSTPNGKLLFHILSAIAEYERELLIERTKAGRALAEKEGKICHRPRKPLDEKTLRQLKAKGVSHRVMARTLGISRSTLLRRLDELGLR